MAINHCELRAFGFFPDQAYAEENGDCCLGESAGCFEKTCGVGESDASRPDSTDVKVSAPSIVACLCQLCSLFDQCCGNPDSDCFSPPEADAAGWVPKWHFERRAAVPAHADPLTA